MSTSHAMYGPDSAQEASTVSPEARIGVTKPDIETSTEFDYVIIGGGTAGLAVAARLAQRTGVMVCVIEAGKDHGSDSVITTPGFYGKAVGNPEYDWGYESIPQPNLKGRTIQSPTGKVLGGSSAINYLASMRASAPEYNAWSQLGNPGWTWEDLVPSFKRSEKYQSPEWTTEAVFPGITKEDHENSKRLALHYKGHEGPIHHTHNVIYTDVLRPCVLTLNNLGIKTSCCPDYGDATGIFNIGTAVDRSSGTRSYSRNYLKLGNVFVLTDTSATKIIFGPEKDLNGNIIAIGVEVKGPQSVILAKREVILSAGTYNSPRLLELSGIGNSELLDRHGIQTIVDLPGVGENLQEHLVTQSDFIVKDSIFTLDSLRNDPEYEAKQRKLYADTGNGAYATTVSGYGYLKLGQIMPASEITQLRHELEKELSETESQQTPLQKAQYKIQKSLLDTNNVGDVEIIMVPHPFAETQPIQGVSYISLSAAIQHPISRGSVHISSNNALDAPCIDPQYLSSAFDTKCLVKTTQFMRKVAETEPLKSFLKKPSTPSSEITTYEQFEDYVRTTAASFVHPIGTVAMVPRELGGVVDPNLLVYGTKNLRVVDLSIVPLHIAAHPCDTAYAIGEKASELIP